MKSHLKFDRLWLILLLTILQPYAAAMAQDTTVTVTVTHIAGDNVYIDAGASSGISVRDTLNVLEANRAVGKMLVVNTASNQSVLAFAGRTFPVTRGKRMIIAFRKRDLSVGEVNTVTAVPQEAPAERIFERPASAKSSSAGRVRLTGRLLVSLSILDSETLPQIEGAQSISRTFITPAINLNTTISNLPSNARIRVHIRSDYRHSSLSSLSPSYSFRTYQLSIEKTFDVGTVQFGRFYDRSTSMGGYWDGLSFMLGSRKKGLGAAFGFMPDRSNEGFTTLFPRFSGFARIERGSSKTVRYRASAAYHEIRPDVTTNYMQHRYAGFDHDLTWGPIFFNQDIQFDRDPTTNNWVVSQLRTDTRILIAEGLSLRGRYSIRQPYRILTLGNPLSTRRDQLGGGISYNKFGGSIGGDYRTQFTRGTYSSRSITAYFATPMVSGFSISGSTNHWKSDFGTALYLSGAISKMIDAMQFRIDYGFYRSTNANQNAPIDLHRYSISASVPILNRLYWNARTSFQQSEYLRSLSMNTSLQIRF